MVELSVCIPAYNAADVIERAIRSVAAQRIDGQMEILVCDDGSTDETTRVVRGLAADVVGLRLICNTTNRGRPFTRNRLVAEAQGRFLTWLDADDEKCDGMLAAQLQKLEQLASTSGDADLVGVLVYTNFHWMPASGGPPVLVEPPEPDDPMEALLDSTFGGYLWLMMGLSDTFRTAGPFDERLPRLQDLGFFIRFAELGGRFVRVETAAPLCVYRKSDAGRDSIEVWRSWTWIWRANRHHFESYGLANARRWRRHHYRVARRYARSNGNRVAYWWVATWEVLFIVRGSMWRALQALAPQELRGE